LLAVLDGPLIEPVNVGKPVEFTMLELADLVLELTDSTSNLVYRPLPSDDPKLRQPDISVARSELGWEPKVALVRGSHERSRGSARSSR
jgi:UDP-glucuronate decarboxylase